jgi:hypothetical protein
MINKYLLFFVATLALAGLACGLDVNLPDTNLKTGPLETTTLAVPVPAEAGDVELTLAFGMGEMTLTPGAASDLVSGVATYNVADFKPEISVEGTRVRVEQGSLNLDGIPDFDDKIENAWTLSLGTTPMLLNINAGAYSGKLELGGLALKSLEVNDGASDVDVMFSTPNLVEMQMFRYNTGASTISIEGIGNANLSTFLFRGGAGSYTLDFSGALNRDLVANIEAGVSTVKIVIPEGVPAQVTFEGAVSDVQTSGTWEQTGDSYQQAGSGPRITLIVKLSAGSLELRNK